MSETPRQILVSTTDAESAPFWEAAQEGVFMLPRCNECQTKYWYPRANCPHCLGDNTDWVESKGRGRVYAMTVMHKAEVPYCIAYVELDEGPRMLTNIEAGDLNAVEIGQRVEVVFVPSATTPHQKVPLFRHVAGQDR